MKLDYLDSGYYMLRRKDAQCLCSGRLPKCGFEKLAVSTDIPTTNGWVWVTQTMHLGRWVWSIRDSMGWYMDHRGFAILGNT
jgi:hypothetical protein